MNEFTIVKQELFENKPCDFYRNGEEIGMTAKQLSECLGYASKSGLEMLINRHEYLKHSDFSSTHILLVPNGNGYSQQETRLFNEDGIYECALLAKTETAKRFRFWVRRMIKSLRTGDGVAVPITITPEMAMDILLHNHNNRKVNKANVKRISADMKLGNFKLNGETIKIYDDGDLADGQHRLLACVESRVPFQTYIIKGVKKDVLPTIDCGEKRSLAASLNMCGIDIDSKMIPAFNFLFNDGNKLSASQVECLYDRFSEECKVITECLPRGSRDYIMSKRDFRAFCLYIMIQHNVTKEQLQTFVDGMKEKPDRSTNFEKLVTIIKIGTIKIYTKEKVAEVRAETIQVLDALKH